MRFRIQRILRAVLIKQIKLAVGSTWRKRRAQFPQNIRTQREHSFLATKAHQFQPAVEIFRGIGNEGMNRLQIATEAYQLKVNISKSTKKATYQNLPKNFNVSRCPF